MLGEPQYSFYGYDNEPIAVIDDGSLAVEWVYIGEGALDNGEADDARLRFRVYQLDDIAGGWEEEGDASCCSNMPLYAEPDLIEESLWWLYDCFREAVDNGDSLLYLSRELSWVSPDAFEDEWDEDDEVGIIDDD